MKPIPSILYWAVGAYILSVPAMSFVPGMNYASASLGVLCVLMFLILGRASRPLLVLPREFVMLAVFIGIAVLSALNSKFPGLSAVRLITMAQIAILFVLLVNICVQGHNMRFILGALILGCLVNLTYTLLGAHSLEGLRQSGFVENSNTFGMLMIIGCFCALWLSTIGFQSWIMKLFNSIIPLAIFPFMYGALLSGSKKALLAIPVVFLCYAYLSYRKFASNRLLGIFYIAVGLIVVALGISRVLLSDSFTRLSQSVGYFQNQDYKIEITRSSTGLRLAYMLAGISMFLSHPLLGVGINNFGANVTKYSKIFGVMNTYAHCNYIEIAATTGMAGFIAYFSIYASILARLIRQVFVKQNTPRSPLSIIILLAFLFFIFKDIAMVSYYDKISWIWLSAILSFTLMQDVAAIDR